ncbi:replication-relaxation family protein [Oligoflexia bacterium]|nr:replication-relaxation family protein [Oligoflexia bacterium]
MKQHAIGALEALNRRRYGRSNFLAALLGGSEQNRRREIGDLYEAGYLIKHASNGAGAIERAYPHYFFPIYEKGPRADKLMRSNGIEPLSRSPSRQFWHQVMVDDILLSIEASCRMLGFEYRDEHLILKGTPRELPCEISHIFKDGTEHCSTKKLMPDALFAVNGTYWALEADRNNEPVERNNLGGTSYLRKLLQYRDVFKKRTFQARWGIDNICVLNVTTNKAHMKNIMTFMESYMEGKSRSLLFCACPALVSPDKAPRPILSLLTSPWNRVGHSDLILADVIARQ